MNLQELKKKRISAISLGCDKNRVDLEKMLYNLKEFGFIVTPDIENCDIVIVNTCAFIEPAIKEAINNILSVLELKNKGLEKVIVTGCLVSRHNEEIVKAIPQVDAFVNLKDNDKIVKTICSLYEVECKYQFKNGRLLTNAPHYAFLKIADGCNNCCSYCTIPRIRGRYISVPMEELIKEAKTLADSGVKELILVAQDTTRYGIDLYDEYKIVPLIKELSKIKEIHWIRIHYLYPEMVTDELLDEIKNNPKVCKYIDIPFQHIDQKILKDMNRRSSEEDIRNLVKNIKENYPEIAIRSTFIIGFPGETKAQFKKLINFLNEARLNNVGFFPFYKEERTRAYFMKKQVWGIVKKRRLNKAQNVQEKVMNANNINRIGQNVEIIVDFFDEDEQYYVCRTSQDSPEVDFVVVVDASANLRVGEFYNVKLTEYLFGTFKGEIV